MLGICALGGGELPDDGAAIQLDGGDEVGGRQVDHEAVDLLGLQR